MGNSVGHRSKASASWPRLTGGVYASIGASTKAGSYSARHCGTTGRRSARTCHPTLRHSLSRSLSHYGPLGWRFAAEGDVNRFWQKQARRKRYALLDKLGMEGWSAKPIDWIEAHRAGVGWCLDAASVLARPKGGRRDQEKCEQASAECLARVPTWVGQGNVVTTPWTLFGPELAPTPSARVLRVS